MYYGGRGKSVDRFVNSDNEDISSFVLKWYINNYLNKMIYTGTNAFFHDDSWNRIFSITNAILKRTRYISKRTPLSVVDIIAFKCNFLGKFH